MTTSAPAPATFEHRQSFADAEGRDKWTDRLVNEWMSSVVSPLLDASWLSHDVAITSNLYETSAGVLRPV